MKKHYITFAVLALFLSASGHSLYAKSSSPVSDLESDVSISVNGPLSASDTICVEVHMSYYEAYYLVLDVLKEFMVSGFYSSDTRLADLGIDSLEMLEMMYSIEYKVLEKEYFFNGGVFQGSLPSFSECTVRDLALATAKSSTTWIYVETEQKK